MSSAEDPEKILEQAVEDMQGDLIRLRQAAAEVTASEKRMQAKFDQAQKTAVSFGSLKLCVKYCSYIEIIRLMSTG